MGIIMTWIPVDKGLLNQGASIRIPSLSSAQGQKSIQAVLKKWWITDDSQPQWGFITLLLIRYWKSGSFWALVRLTHLTAAAHNQTCSHTWAIREMNQGPRGPATSNDAPRFPGQPLLQISAVAVCTWVSVIALKYVIACRMAFISRGLPAAGTQTDFQRNFQAKSQKSFVHLRKTPLILRMNISALVEVRTNQCVKTVVCDIFVWLWGECQVTKITLVVSSKLSLNGNPLSHTDAVG